ncbi:hypothetical protein [Nocardia heshunensis]
MFAAVAMRELCTGQRFPRTQQGEPIIEQRENDTAHPTATLHNVDYRRGYGTRVDLERCCVRAVFAQSALVVAAGRLGFALGGCRVNTLRLEGAESVEMKSFAGLAIWWKISCFGRLAGIGDLEPDPASDGLRPTPLVAGFPHPNTSQ